MLRKLPEARPTLTRCSSVFDGDFVNIRMLTPAQHARLQLGRFVQDVASMGPAGL